MVQYRQEIRGLSPPNKLKKASCFSDVQTYLIIVSESVRKKQLQLRGILMDLIKILEMFPDQAACIAHLECLRWQGTPECLHCESKHVNEHNETATGGSDAGIATIVIALSELHLGQ